MLSKIAVLGKVKGIPADDTHEYQYITVDSGAPLPSGITAIVAGSNAPDLPARISEIAQQQQQLLLLVSEAVDAREGLPSSSGPRLLQFATRFAQALQLSPDEQSQLERGALLHDIGKLRVSNDVLLKKSVLDYDEWVSLQRHTIYGAELLVEIKLHTDLVEIVRSHHENYDGTGYPDELERENIPRLARAMKILDVYCAMTAPRHYRRNTHTHESVLEHLRSERGKHFDPELLDIFLNICEQE